MGMQEKRDMNFAASFIRLISILTFLQCGIKAFKNYEIK